ncbi:MAG: hypothetical protein HY291_07500 [Planctomycetes bacterium]|nr:hypothetical protein [Planctomycetota bacterium]
MANTRETAIIGSARMRPPSGPVKWHVMTRDGYKIRCLGPYQRFRGLDIPWNDIDALATVTEFVAKSSRSRKVVKLAAGQFGTPIEVYVKRYNFKTWYGPLLRVTRKSRAREEFELGWKVMEAGIRTPRPVWLAEAEGAVSHFSLLATEAIPECENVIERWWRLESEPERCELLLALGRFILMFHDRGFYHDDCKAEHFLVLPNAPSTPGEFFIIDLLGCSMAKSVSRLNRAKNLYQILRSFLPKKDNHGFTPDHKAVLLQAYGGSLAEAAKWSTWINRIGSLKGHKV